MFVVANCLGSVQRPHHHRYLGRDVLCNSAGLFFFPYYNRIRTH